MIPIINLIDDTYYYKLFCSRVMVNRNHNSTGVTSGVSLVKKLKLTFEQNMGKVEKFPVELWLNTLLPY